MKESIADLTVAVGVGMALAALLYIRRIAETTTVAAVTPEYLRDGQAHILQDKDIPSHVTILRIHGPFLFGATGQLTAATDHIQSLTPIVILRLRNMTAAEIPARVWSASVVMRITNRRSRRASARKTSTSWKAVARLNPIRTVCCDLPRRPSTSASGINIRTRLKLSRHFPK